MPMTITWTFAPGQIIYASRFNTNFSDVKNWADTHEVATTAVHGVGAGSIVGTTLTQTLTNKTFDDNLVWKSGTAFKGTMDHANTADRVYTYPDASGTIVFSTSLDAYIARTNSGNNVTDPTGAQDVLTRSFGDGRYDAIGAAAAVVSDVAYNSGTWNGVTTIAPSKNAVRDWIETLGTAAYTASTAYDASGSASTAQSNSQSYTDGKVTVTNHAVVVGKGSSGFTAIGPGTTGTILVGNTGADPSFSSSVGGPIIYKGSIFGTFTPTVGSGLSQESSATITAHLVSGTTDAGGNATVTVTSGLNFWGGIISFNDGTVWNAAPSTANTRGTVPDYFSYDPASGVLNYQSQSSDQSNEPFRMLLWFSS